MRDSNEEGAPEAIGERRLTEGDRRMAEARVQAIFDHALDGIVLASVPDRALTTANPAFLRMTGYALEELAGLRIDDLCRQQDLPGILEHFEKQADGNIPLLETIAVRRRDGSVFHADINCSSLPVDSRHYVLWEFRDITDRLAAQEALREQEARHHRFYHSLREAFAMVDMAGFIVDCNLAFQEMVGYSLAELKGKNFRDLTPAKWHDFEQKIITRQVIPDGQSQLYEKEYIHRNGTIFPVELKAVLLRDKNDQPEAMWAIVRDLTERRRNDAALRESEERFRTLLSNIPSVAVQGYGFDGITRYWTQASERLYGYTRKEAIGANLLDLIVPSEMIPGFRSAIRQMVETAQPIPPSALSLMHKDGSRVEVFSSHGIVQIPGLPPELYCFDIDLTQSRRMDAERRQTERRLTVALENSPVAVFEQDSDLRYKWAFNPMLGYAPREVLGKTDGELMDAECATRLTAVKHSVMEAGEPAHREIAVRRPDGPVEYYDLHIEPQYDANGQVMGLIGAAINITALTEQQKELSKALAQRQWAEAVLREREQQLALFVEYAPASIAMFDRHMRYLAASRRWLNDHGVARQDIRGLWHYDLVPSIPEKWRAVHARCLAGAVERGDEDVFVGADGRERSIRWEVRPWQEVAGKIGGIIIFSEDITEVTQKRKELAKAKAEAEQANAAKSQFLAAASHDLRQPLHALDLYLGIIADRLPASSADVVARMKECSANLSDLLNELLDLSKLDAGAVKPRVQDFSLAEFLDRVASTHAPSAEQKDLLFRVARTRQTGRTDPQLLQQLVANLVSNAIRYTERGSVLIGIRRREGSLWIEVWDTGIGIPADMQREIFEPFKQLGNPERNRKGGTGLGLALVQRLARLLGLRIRVASHLGRGSLFAVEVPLGSASESCCATDCQHHGKPGRRLRVALIEDDPQVREATEHGLVHLGHEVVAAADTGKLLAGLAEVAPDLVIADYRLAGNTTGLDAIAAVCKHYGGDIQAVVITGDTDPGVIQRIRKSGLPVLNKPLQLDQLHSCLDEIDAARAPTELPV